PGRRPFPETAGPSAARGCGWPPVPAGPSAALSYFDHFRRAVRWSTNATNPPGRGRGHQPTGGRNGADQLTGTALVDQRPSPPPAVVTGAGARKGWLPAAAWMPRRLATARPSPPAGGQQRRAARSTESLSRAGRRLSPADRPAAASLAAASSASRESQHAASGRRPWSGRSADTLARAACPSPGGASLAAPPGAAAAGPHALAAAAARASRRLAIGAS